MKAAPAAVPVGDLEKLIFEILEIADGELRGLSMEDVRRNIAASIACRAAIKINMRLDQAKMEWLLSALAATDYPMACPHGRPIALQYPTREILKASIGFVVEFFFRSPPHVGPVTDRPRQSPPVLPYIGMVIRKRRKFRKLYHRPYNIYY